MRITCESHSVIFAAVRGHRWSSGLSVFDLDLATTPRGPHRVAAPLPATSTTGPDPLPGSVTPRSFGEGHVLVPPPAHGRLTTADDLDRLGDAQTPLAAHAGSRSSQSCPRHAQGRFRSCHRYRTRGTLLSMTDTRLTTRPVTVTDHGDHPGVISLTGHGDRLVPVTMTDHGDRAALTGVTGHPDRGARGHLTASGDRSPLTDGDRRPTGHPDRTGSSHPDRARPVTRTGHLTEEGGY